MNATTFTSRASAGLVAAIAGFASYNHIVKVAREAGEHLSVAAVLPLSIDGLIVVGTMAMLDDKRNGRRPRLSARVALGFGVVATLCANVASARPTMTARLVAAVPALAFLIAVEVLARTGRAVAEPEQIEEAAAAVETEPGAVDPDPVDNLSTAMAARKPHPTAEPRVVAAHRRTPKATDEQLASRLKLSVKTVRRYRPDDHAPEPAAEARINGHQVLEDVSA